MISQDSSFFIVQSEDLEKSAAQVLAETGDDKFAQVNRYIQNKIIAFNVSEEVGKLTTGSLQIYDPYHVYSRIFRNGMRFDITWGYKLRNAELISQRITDANPNEITGQAERKGLKCTVQNPTGNASPDGNIVYNVTFYSREIFTDRIIKLWSNGTYGDVVRDILNQLDILPQNQIIDFRLANEKLNNNTALRQEETNYKFLLRHAYEWRCIFQIGYNPEGERVAMFVDFEKMEKNEYAEKVTGGRGFYRTLEYRDGLANVINYSWKQHVGESGTGDAVRLTVVNGQTIVQRYQAEDETITTWKFNPEKISEELQAVDSISDKTALVRQWLKIKDFQKLVEEKFFIPVTHQTAPQGFGYTVNAKIIGDPLVTCPMRINFGRGFPDGLRQSDPEDVIRKALTSFYLKGVKHTISQKGYQMDLSIVDALTINGGAVQ